MNCLHIKLFVYFRILPSNKGFIPLIHPLIFYFTFLLLKSLIINIIYVKTYILPAYFLLLVPI